MNAVQGRSIEKATFLLDRGADPNAADKRGFTALHRAAEMGLRELVELLLARHAAPHPSAQRDIRRVHWHNTAGRRRLSSSWIGFRDGRKRRGAFAGTSPAVPPL